MENRSKSKATIEGREYRQSGKAEIFFILLNNFHTTVAFSYGNLYMRIFVTINKRAVVFIESTSTIQNHHRLRQKSEGNGF